MTKNKINNVTEANESFDSYLLAPIGTSCSQSTSLVVLPSPCGKFIMNFMIFYELILETISFVEDDASTVVLGMDQLNPSTPNLTIKEIVKSLIDFIASR